MKNKYSMIVVSDCHFYSADDENAKLFLEAVYEFNIEELEYFILLGDIFDFCFGASRYFKEKFQEFYKAFKYLSESGVKVIFMQGNHEFSFDEMAWPGVEIITSFEKTIMLRDGSRFYLTHGDRLLAPPSYFWYLKITRSKIFSLVARLLPQKQLDDLALSISRKSRSKDQYRTLDHEKVLGAVNKWLRPKPDGHGLFGHFHHPYFSKRTEASIKGMTISMNSWYKPNFLMYKTDDFYRAYFEGDGWKVEKTEV